MKKCRNYAEACVGTCRNACTLKKERSASMARVEITMRDGDTLNFKCDVLEAAKYQHITDINVSTIHISWPGGGSWRQVIL